MYKSLFLILLLAAILAGRAMADEIDTSAWPASWMQPLIGAKAYGITRFHEAPVLTARVSLGELPDLAHRLPADPPVLEPIESVGRYGGTARIFNSDWDKVNVTECPLTVDPSSAQIFPNLIEHWEFSEDAREVRFWLRRGIKWSDGAPFTSNDFIFFHRHVQMNEELTPLLPPEWENSRAVRINDYEFSYVFVEPFPLIINVFAQLGDYFFAPSEYMKQFHPDFVPREGLLGQIEDEGYISWMGYFNAVLRWTRNRPPLAPTLRPYQMVERTPVAEYYERNPFYWKVDPKGNQLPYMDGLRAEIVENQDVLAAKAATGQVDFAAFELKTQDFPLFKLGEATSNIKVHVWNRIHGSDVLIMPNLTIEDDRLRTIFQDVRFRRALSVAINREEMNSIIYFNRGVPRQGTVIPTSRFYETRFAQAYAQYDPAQARSWLDEMDLVDRDGDGQRDYSDGDGFTVTLEYYDFETPKDISLELVTSYWRDIGLDIRLKKVDAALQTSRATAGLMQMTVWHADRTTDILFPFQPQWYVPMHIGWEESHWNPWSTYHLSGGERGEKPPPQVLQLQRWWEEMTRSMDPDRVTELGKNILRSTAENVWTIGTVGLAPQPVVVSNRMRNVPERGYWGWDNRWTMAYHPATWYLESASR